MELRQDERFPGELFFLRSSETGVRRTVFDNIEFFCFQVYVCEMEMDTQICLKRNIHKRSEDEINRIVDYFEPTPGYHQKLDVTSLLQEESIEEVPVTHKNDAQKFCRVKVLTKMLPSGSYGGYPRCAGIRSTGERR